MAENHMNLFHLTSRSAALSIENDGFRDVRGKYPDLLGMEQGVWVSDRPLDSNEFGTVIDDSAILEIEVDESQVHDYECIDDGIPYREWLVPAAILNAGRARRIA
jgi:hypothetical protein